MKIVLLNAGSSSLKAALMESVDRTTIAQGQADWAGGQTRFRFVGPDGVKSDELVDWTGHDKAVERFAFNLQAAGLGAPRAVGHRVVHGGPYSASVRINADVRRRIDSLTALAPLHNPPSLAALSEAERIWPDIPHVAVFDTAFHSSAPAEAYTFPIPRRWTTEWSIRRYGFHGLSHAYCARRASELLHRRSENLRIVICHLGHGCSACAVRDGLSIESTMGFTPLDGLMMATRCGTIDPGVILHLQQRHGLSPDEIDFALNRQSGLLGVSGVSSDMRQVLAAADQGNAEAALAVAIYVRRVRQAIASLAAAMNGLDVLVFTAGVGENSSVVREKVCAGLEFLGVRIDANINLACRPDVAINGGDSKVQVLVIASREDLTMCDEVCSAISLPQSESVDPQPARNEK